MYDDWGEDNKIDLETILDVSKYEKLFILNSRPVDPTGIFVYRAILSKMKSKDWSNPASWGVKLIYRAHDRWRLSTGQWTLISLANHLNLNDEDFVFVNLQKNIYVTNMIQVVEEAIWISEEQDSKNAIDAKKQADALQQNWKNKSQSPPKPDYSKMKKWEIQKEVNDALDRGDQEKLNQLAPYIKESINFERGQEPKRSMNIGVITWKDIQPGDIFQYVKKTDYALFADVGTYFIVIEVLKRGRTILKLEVIHFDSDPKTVYRNYKRGMVLKKKTDIGEFYYTEWNEFFRILQYNELNESLMPSIYEYVKFDRWLNI